MEMKNVLDQLKAIAENNDSEDVARAIQTTSDYSFKDRLAEMEAIEEDDQGIYGQQGAMAADDGGAGVPDDVQVSNEDGGEDDIAYDPQLGDDEAMKGDDPFARIHDRVEDRGGSSDDGLGDDPWGIGDGDGDEAVEECGDDGSALDRVQDRAVRSGDGGPVDRVQTRHTERRSALEEELGMVFNTPMERHSWIMNQLNDLSQQLDPEDAAMVKALLKKVGNADVKGGNC